MMMEAPRSISIKEEDDSTDGYNNISSPIAPNQEHSTVDVDRSFANMSQEVIIKIENTESLSIKEEDDSLNDAEVELSTSPGRKRTYVRKVVDSTSSNAETAAGRKPKRIRMTKKGTGDPLSGNWDVSSFLNNQSSIHPISTEAELGSTTPKPSTSGTQRKSRLGSLVKKDLGSQTKGILMNVWTYVGKLADPSFLEKVNLKKRQEVTAEICGVSLRSVQRCCQEDKNSVSSERKFLSPRKRYKREKSKTELSDFDNDVVRRCVFEFYDRCEFPSAQRLLPVLKEKINYSGCDRSVRRLLNNLGFKYKKSNDGRKFLLEKSDISLARVNFLRKMHTLKQEPIERDRVYLDETWLNENHSQQDIWQSSDINGGLKVPVGKCKCLIVCHAGNKNGLFPECKWVFQSKPNSTDYPNEMNQFSFHEWFVTRLLPSLEEPSVIIMDNASYHSALKENSPVSSWPKQEIIEWLQRKNVDFPPDATKLELLAKVKPLKKKVNLFDELALEAGHEIIRLPPYHCQYNPIELIWAQIKREVGGKNISSKISDVERLTNEAINHITAEDWKECFRCAEQQQEEDWAKEIVRDDILEPIIINIAEDTASDDTEDSDDDY